MQRKNKCFAFAPGARLIFCSNRDTCSLTEKMILSIFVTRVSLGIILHFRAISAAINKDLPLPIIEEN